MITLRLEKTKCKIVCSPKGLHKSFLYMFSLFKDQELKIAKHRKHTIICSSTDIHKLFPCMSGLVNNQESKMANPG